MTKETKGSTAGAMLASRGAQLSLLTIALTAAVYSRTALGPLQETIRVALPLSDNQIALLQGPALALPMLLIAVPLGLIVDRFSRVRLLLLLTMTSLVGSLLTARAPTFGALFGARALVGFSAFAMNPASLSLLADLYEPAQRGRAGIAMLVGQFAGVAAVFAVGGELLHRLNVTPDSWRTTMLWMTGPPLALVGMLMFALREPIRVGRTVDNLSAGQSLQRFWRLRQVILPILGGKVAAQVGLQSLLIWAAPTLARTFALAPDRVGDIIALVIPFGGIAGTVLGGVLADSCERAGGARRTVLVAGVLALACLPVGSMFFAPVSLVMIDVLLLVLVALLTAVAVMAATLCIVVVPTEIRGLTVGVMSGLGVALATGLGPLLVSGLSGRIGGPDEIGHSLAVVCAASGVLCAVILGLGRRYLRHTATA